MATEVPITKKPKRLQMCTIEDDCAQIADSDVKSAFASPHLDAASPEETFIRQAQGVHARTIGPIIITLHLVIAQN